MDFAEFRFPWGKRYALLVVLEYSPLLWYRFAPRQDIRTLLTGLEDAFLAFGDVPQELLSGSVRFSAGGCGASSHPEHPVSDQMLTM